jgi:hypothetical protein
LGSHQEGVSRKKCHERSSFKPIPIHLVTTVYIACTLRVVLVTARSATRATRPDVIVVSARKRKAVAFASLSLSQETVMKTAWLALPAVALAVACNEPSSPAATGGLLASSQASSGVVNRVSVGGSDQDATLNTDANFSLIALEKGDGTIAGEWSDQFGQGQGGVHVDVNCLRVVGNQAWIGGIIRSGSTGAGGVDLSGLPALTRVADLGKSASDPADAISFTFIGLAVQCSAQPNLPLLAMTGGQVTVN